ncbi:hypothetical protein PG990_012242 [Apiospora arundinis]
MDLFKLPPELLQEMFDQFVLSLSQWRIVRLRLVDSRFRDLVDNSIFRLRYLSQLASSKRFSSYYFNEGIGLSLPYFHRYLEYQVRREGYGPSLSAAGQVYRVAQALSLIGGETGQDAVSSCIKSIIPLATKKFGHELLVNDRLEYTDEDLEADVFILAAHLGREAFVERHVAGLTQAGIDPWTRYESGSTIFGSLRHAVVFGGHLGIIKLLYPMDPESRLSVAIKALNAACINRNRAVLDWASREISDEDARPYNELWGIPWVDVFEHWMAKLDPDWTHVYTHGEHSLECFRNRVEAGDLTMARYHFSHSFWGTLDSWDGGYSLWLALDNGDEEMVQWLLEKGADPNRIVHYCSVDALSFVIKKDGTARMLRLLLQHGTPPNERRPPPIVYAVLMEREDLLRVLLDHGARLDTPETGGWAMRAAKMHGIPSMMDFLSRRGLDEDEVYHYVPTYGETFKYAWAERPRRN